MLTVPTVCFLGHVAPTLFDKIVFVWTFLFVFLQEADWKILPDTEEISVQPTIGNGTLH
jgi:hypothetical protein